MGIRDLKYPTIITKLPQSFDNWRKDIIKEVEQICLNHQKLSGPKGTISNEIRLAFKTFPKTIVRVTRQMCKCQDDCTNYSLYYTRFSKQKCKYFDVENLLTDEKYYNSALVNKKVMWDSLVDSETKINEVDIILGIDYAINELCDERVKGLKSLKCKFYEGLSYCSNTNISCIRRILQSEIPIRQCNNLQYRRDIRSLGRKFFIPEQEELRSRQRNIREIFSDDPAMNSGLTITYGNLVALIPLILMFLYFIREMSWKSKILIFAGILGFFYCRLLLK